MAEVQKPTLNLMEKCLWFTTDLYKNPFKRQFIKNAVLFSIGVWLAREFSNIDIVGPAVPAA